jgi:hypothetical protein
VSYESGTFPSDLRTTLEEEAEARDSNGARWSGDNGGSVGGGTQRFVDSEGTWKDTVDAEIWQDEEVRDLL